jgi:RNA polymerase sigma factor (sigma-70 family)
MTPSPSAAPTKRKALTKADKKRLRTGPILDVQKFVNVFVTRFCGQYSLTSWLEEIETECLVKYYTALKTHPDKMEIPWYVKRVIINAALHWKDRAVNHDKKDSTCIPLEDFHHPEIMKHEEPEPFLQNLHCLNDVERLILELRYGFGRGSEEEELSLSEISRRIGHSETWVRDRHARALKKIEVFLTK